MIVISFSSAFVSLADCGPPPAVPNAQPALKGLTSFPENTVITYRCDENFMKIPGKQDSVMCLPDSQWSDIEEFCNRKFLIFFKKSYGNEMYLKFIFMYLWSD